MTTNVVIYDQCYNSEESNLIAVNLALGEGLIIIVKLKVPLMVRSGQVRSDSNSNSNSNVGPELYTKIGFHHHHSPTHHTISK